MITNLKGRMADGGMQRSSVGDSFWKSARGEWLQSMWYVVWDYQDRESKCLIASVWSSPPRMPSCDDTGWNGAGKLVWYWNLVPGRQRVASVRWEGRGSDVQRGPTTFFFEFNMAVVRRTGPLVAPRPPIDSRVWSNQRGGRRHGRWEHSGGAVVKSRSGAVGVSSLHGGPEAA